MDTRYIVKQNGCTFENLFAFSINLVVTVRMFNACTAIASYDLSGLDLRK